MSRRAGPTAPRYPLPLAADEVHLWVAALDSPPVEAGRRLAAASGDERERAALHRRREDAERYLSAHGALRLILGDYVAHEPGELRFLTRENGKPFLEGSEIEFNLSHSGDIALVGVARNRQVGVDVERLRPVPDLDTLAPRVCSPGELATLAALAEPHRERAFFSMWTRKEALAKATGEGISAVFRDGRREPVESDDRWTVVEIDDLAGYAACVAAEGSGWRLVRRNVTDSNGER